MGERRDLEGKKGASFRLLISLLFRAAIQIIQLPNKLLDSQLTSQ